MSNQTDLIDFIAELSSSDADITLHFYDLLRVHPSAEQEVIESAYRRLLRLYHPDVNKHPLANNVTKMLINAYEILGDSTKRAEYDTYLASNKEDGQSAFEVDRQEQIAFYMERGEAYETNDKRDLAIQDFTRVVELDPYNDLAYQRRGMLYALEEEYALAIRDYTEAIEIDSSNWVAYQSRGWAYWYEGRNDLAKQDLERSLGGWSGIGAHETNIPYLLIGYGWANSDGSHMHMPSEGMQTLMELFVREIIASDGGQGKIAREERVEEEQQHLAERNRATQSKLNLVIQECTEAMVGSPYNTDLYNVRAEAYEAKVEYDLAIQDWTKALALDPYNAEFYNARAEAYYIAGWHELAINDHMKAIELNPDDVDVRWSSAETFVSLGEYALAIRDFTKIIELDPDEYSIYERRGEVYKAQKNYDLAIEDFTRAIKTASSVSVPYLYSKRGETYRDRGEVGLAIQDFNRAIDLNPNNHRFYRSRGEAFRQMGEVNLARQDFDKSEELEERREEPKGLSEWSVNNDERKVDDLLRRITYLKKPR